MPKKANKKLNITIFFCDRFELTNLFHKITKSIHKGTQQKSEEVNGSYYDFQFEYAPRYNYEEKVINGNVCYTFKSKKQ